MHTSIVRDIFPWQRIIRNNGQGINGFPLPLLVPPYFHIHVRTMNPGIAGTAKAVATSRNCRLHIANTRRGMAYRWWGRWPIPIWISNTQRSVGGGGWGGEGAYPASAAATTSRNPSKYWRAFFCLPKYIQQRVVQHCATYEKHILSSSSPYAPAVTI